VVLRIIGSSSSEPANKKRRRNHKEGYNMLECKDSSSNPSGLMYQSHSPRKTFSSRTTHIMMQWSYLVIKGFLVHSVLLHTGSAADIIFAKVFRQMQEQDDKIHDATHPLCGFGGR
jgi:hypothetical protein